MSTVARVQKYSKTYRLGLLQAQAFRILKQRTGDILAPHGITTLDWAVMGFVYDTPGTTFKQVSKAVTVTAPVVTTTCDKLLQKGYISVSKNDMDTRVKYITLTPLGSAFVDTNESLLRTTMKPLVGGASVRDLLGYIATLEAIVGSEHPKEHKPYRWFM